MGRTYKTMQGREVDMEKLMSQNELMPAIGNAKVNARGDELGPGGKITRKREEIVAEYYDTNPKAVNRPTSGIVGTKAQGQPLTEEKPTSSKKSKQLFEDNDES